MSGLNGSRWQWEAEARGGAYNRSARCARYLSNSGRSRGDAQHSPLRDRSSRASYRDDLILAWFSSPTRASHVSASGQEAVEALHAAQAPFSLGAVLRVSRVALSRSVAAQVLA